MSHTFSSDTARSSSIPQSQPQRLDQRRLRVWQLWRINPSALAWNAVREFTSMMRFVVSMSREQY